MSHGRDPRWKVVDDHRSDTLDVLQSFASKFLEYLFEKETLSLAQVQSIKAQNDNGRSQMLVLIGPQGILKAIQSGWADLINFMKANQLPLGGMLQEWAEPPIGHWNSHNCIE